MPFSPTFAEKDKLLEDMSLAQKIVEIRKIRGFSQEELANKAGINLRTLQRIEKGETEPRGHTLRAIVEVLDVPVEELMDFTKKEDPVFLTVLCLSALAYWFTPLLNIIVPLVLWLLKRHEIKGVDELGRQIMSFQILWSLVTYISFILFGMSMMLHWPGTFLFMALGFFLYLVNIVFILISFFRLRKGAKKIYPFRLKFI